MATREVTKNATSPNPAVGLAAVRALRRLADKLEALHVGHARDLGWSWQAIAEALGITRQSVHQKYGQGKKEGP